MRSLLSGADLHVPTHMHIGTGTGGAGLEKCGFDPTRYGNFSAVHVNKWGYIRVAATEAALKIEFVDNEDGGTYDSTTLLPWD